MKAIVLLALVLVAVSSVETDYFESVADYGHYTYNDYIDCTSTCQDEWQPMDCMGDGECKTALFAQFACVGANSDCNVFNNYVMEYDGESEIGFDAYQAGEKCYEACHKHSGVSWMYGSNKCSAQCIDNASVNFEEEEEEEEEEEGSGGCTQTGTYGGFVSCVSQCQSTYPPSTCFGDGECRDLLMQSFQCAGTNANCLQFSSATGSHSSCDWIGYDAIYSEQMCLKDCYSTHSYTSSYFFDLMNRCTATCIDEAEEEGHEEEEEEEWEEEEEEWEEEEGEQCSETGTYGGYVTCTSRCSEWYTVSDCVGDGECYNLLLNSLQCAATDGNCLAFSSAAGSHQSCEWIDDQDLYYQQTCLYNCYSPYTSSYMFNEMMQCNIDCVDESEEEGGEASAEILKCAIMALVALFALVF